MSLLLRSPAEYFIKYLILRKPEMSQLQLRDELVELGLDYVSLDYLQRVRKKLGKRPEQFFPEDPSHTASTKFLIEQKLLRIFRPDGNMRTATAILEFPRVREFVEAMLLTGAPLQAICNRAEVFRVLHLSPPALEAYSHYYWNIALLDSSQMRILLRLRREQMVEHADLKDRPKGTVTEAYYKDARKLAADFPHNPVVALMVQQRMGFRMGKEELVLLLQEARTMGAQRAVEAAYNDGPGDFQKYAHYANGVRVLTDVLEVAVKPEENLHQQLAAFQLETDNRPLPTVHQLSSGQHTADLEPTQEQDDGTERDPIQLGAGEGPHQPGPRSGP